MRLFRGVNLNLMCRLTSVPARPRHIWGSTYVIFFFPRQVFFFNLCTSVVHFHRVDIRFHSKGKMTPVKVVSRHWHLLFFYRWEYVKPHWLLIMSSAVEILSGATKKTPAGQETEDPVSVLIFCSVIVCLRWSQKEADERVKKWNYISNIIQPSWFTQTKLTFKRWVLDCS